MSSKVNINILTWNAEKYLRQCLDSVLAQDYQNFEILIIDNNSQDKTGEIISDYLKSLKLKTQSSKPIEINFIQNKENVGFAKGHNQGIKETDGEYVMLLNQDAILAPNFLTEAIKVLEKDKTIGVVQPKVLRYDFGKNQPKDIFDTTGLLTLRNRRIINRGQGEKDEGQYNIEDEVFGADGAVPIYRRRALENTKLPISVNQRLPASKAGRDQRISALWEYFDQSFFAYKEDVDLAWRMKLYRWKTIYASQVVAYHERGAGDSASTSGIDIVRERRKISLFAKTLSWKNQRLMQIKNEIPSLFLKHLPWILWKEIRAWGYVILFEPKILKCLPDLFRQIPKALRQRRIIMRNKKVGAREMKRWFNS